MTIPYGRQSISPADIEAVVRVLQSDFLTQGPVVPAFEVAVAQKVGAQHAVAVNSATSALHIACLALGLQPGDLLWTVPNTFVASANCGRYCGADIDFVDIDPLTWNISIARLEEKLIRAKQNGRLPKVVVPVHFGGQPTEQEAIWELAQQYGFKVLEDASHSIGSSRSGEMTGSCRWSDITVFSFHPVKIITSGEGGMALTNDERLAWQMSMLRSHGITREQDRFLNESLGAWYYEQQLLGFNYRMTEIEAALGVSQLSRIDLFVEQRNALAAFYDDALKELPLQVQVIQSGNRSAYHLYVVQLDAQKVPKPHRQIFDELRRAGIGVNVHYMPVHAQPYYRQLGFTEGAFPVAENYGAHALSLPLYPELTREQQIFVVDKLKVALN